jgi:hypothetical protein
MGKKGFSKITELSVNAAELLMNSAELSANVTEFWFFGRLLFISPSKANQPNFNEFFQILQKSTKSTTSDFFSSARFFKH